MDPKAEKIRNKSEEIEAVLSEWGFIPGTVERDTKKAQIKSWLSNFRPSEIEDAFVLLTKVQYKDPHLIKAAIKRLATEITSIFEDDFSGVRFFPLGNSPSSSGGMYLYDYRKELALSEENFPYIEFHKTINNTKAFVFFDDMIGSGNQAIRFANDNLRGLQIKSYYAAVFAFDDGLKRIKDEACFENVICGSVLSNEERAFHPNSEVFSDEGRRNILETLCKYYGQHLYPKHPLGYDDTQALLAFPHNTPNNTLPIIWASPENEKEKGYPWTPIFERKKKERKQCLSALLPNSTYHLNYDITLVGREADETVLKSFLLNSNQHFFLLWGVGGMGKTHLLSKVLLDIDQSYIYHQCNNEFSLKKLFNICGLKNVNIGANIEENIQIFVEKFANNNIHLILDDFYEVIDEEVRRLARQMTRAYGGKLLIVSRAVPRELNNIDDVFPKHKLPPLKEADYYLLLDNYALWKSPDILISDEIKRKIYEKTLGYPLAGHFIIRLLAVRENIDSILNHLVKFDEEVDPEGKEFSGRLLSVIFEKENKRELNLLCQFCAFTEPVDINGIKKLDSYDFSTLENLLRKDLIWLVGEEKLSTHPLVREFAYSRLDDKPKTHHQIAEYYESLAHFHGLDNIDSFEMALYHNRVNGTYAVESFKSRMYGTLRGSGVKEILASNVKSTIKRLSYGINLYPDYLPYHNELGIAYRENKQLDKAIEVLSRALEIDPKNVLIHNELGIAYRKNKQLDKAIEVLSRALEIDLKNVLIHNELGITYRENKQLDKAIEVLGRAREIDPTHMPSANELGIAYRENNLLDQAASIFEKASTIDPKNPFILKSILELYVFFIPKKTKAQHYFNLSTKCHISQKKLGIKKRIYNEFIDCLDEIVSATCTDYNLYERYVFSAIRVRALHSILPLLFALNEKYPNNPRFISRIGKTMANPVINKDDEAMTFIIKAISLYKQSMDKDQESSHILYYLRGLLHAGKTDVFKEALDKYSSDLSEDHLNLIESDRLLLKY